MLKVDIHTHILPKTWPNLKEKYGYGGFVQLEHHQCGAKMVLDGDNFREVKENCWDPQRRLVECDAQDLHVQVLSTVPIMFNYWAKPKDTLDLSQYLNDHIAHVVREFPKRFVGLGTVPLQDTQLAILELDRCVNELNLAGVQIGSHVNGKELGDTDLFEFFEAASSLKAAIFVHPWDMLAKDRLEKYWLSWLVGMPTETTLAVCSLIFNGVLEKLPNLKIAFAHGGGSFPGLLGRIAHGHRVRPDLVAIHNTPPPEKYLKQLYFDSLTHDPKMLAHLIDLVGVERIAFGSDYPFPLGELEFGHVIESLSLSDREKEFLYSKTALNWLGLNQEAFLK